MNQDKQREVKISDIVFEIHSMDRFIEHEHNERFKVVGVEPDVEDDPFATGNTTRSNTKRHTPVPNLAVPFLRITFDQIPRQPDMGWVFGNEPGVCDILLNRNDVSRQQFTIVILPDTNAICVKNMSRYGTIMRETQEKGSNPVRVRSQRAISEEITIYFQQVQLIIRCPNHSGHRSQFIRNVQTFRAQGGNPQSLVHTDSRVNPSISTQQTSYRNECEIGTGAYGKVYRAINRYTGKFYAIKRYNRPAKTRFAEAEVLKKLKHVCCTNDVFERLSSFSYSIILLSSMLSMLISLANLSWSLLKAAIFAMHD